ncbi:hypothetical protein V6N13_094513 [Hibiscus sabdariffa]|uniref:Uncharacterized protein n=1 Tax=Hibiscus sabdariffa TaxID=183260 RepID=A0ABR2PPV4_9ROSI
MLIFIKKIQKGGKEVLPKSSWKNTKQHADIKANDEEELVKVASYKQISHSSISSLSKPENLVASSGVDTSSGDTLDAKSRARSSPFRRLSDPLLKPKAVSCCSFTNQLQ